MESDHSMVTPLCLLTIICAIDNSWGRSHNAVMNNDRRTFMKRACLTGMCACGARPMAAAQDGQGQQEAAAEARISMPQSWIATLLLLLAAGDREAAARLLKGCASSHYADLKMGATVQRFRGRLQAFLDFLRGEWGWIVDYDQAQAVITVNENKSACVCPLVHKGYGRDLGILCHCSEGFNEKMFSEVVGSPVKVTVTESILRGHPSCKYRIDLKPS